MRRRVIDPGFWTDSKITELSFDARLLYVGLWQYADDEGLFVEDLKNIKMTLFPDQKFLLENSYRELTDAGFFRFGTMTDGARIVEIRRFKNHQHINRPTPSKLRGDFVMLTEDSVSTHSQVKLSKDKLSKDKLGHSVSATESDKLTLYSSPKVKRKLTRPDSAAPAAFDAFYQAYPRHVAREAAEKAWLKLSPSPELQALIMAAVVRYAAEDREPKFIPHPATWINQERWTDEATPTNGNGPPKFRDLGNGTVEADGLKMTLKDYERKYGARAS